MAKFVASNCPSMKKILRGCFFLFSSIIYGQYNDNLSYGIKVGALHSTITNIPEMLIGRENQLTKFTLEEKGVYGAEGGVFLNYKFPDSRMGIQPEILYRQSGAEVNYNNDITKESYKVSFKYQYLVLGATYKFYPYDGINVGVGIHYNKNISPNSIEYSSNEESGNNDTAHRQFYRDAIKGKDDFNLGFSLGYEFKEYLHFDLRYYMGIGDVMESKASSFQFIENTNRNSMLSFSIGYSFHTW